MSIQITYLPLDVQATAQARLFSQSQCTSCVGTDELCPACQDLKDTRDTDNAHAIVDDGNMQYPHQLAWLGDEPSGHDWIAAIVRVKPARLLDGTIVDERREFLEPGTNLTDRLFSDPDTELSSSETICAACHYTYHKYTVCPNCN